MIKVAPWALAATLSAAPTADGRPGLNAVGCLGEAFANFSGDMAGSTILPQIGFSLEYRTPWVAVSNTPTVGYYSGRPVLEDWMGLEFGWDLAWARPAFMAGIGVQSFHRKVFLSDGDEYHRIHEVRFPGGIGLRLWLFQSFYGEWQGRFFPEGGVPWWRMEFGYKVL